MTVPYPTDPALPARLQSYLRSGEELLWCGRPDPSVRPGEDLLWCGKPDPLLVFTPADGYLIPFTTLWLAFAVFWESAAWGSGFDFARVWGIPFIAIGIYNFAGRFFYKIYRKRRTVYGVTRERAVLAVGGSFSDMPLKTVSIRIRRGRSGRHASVTFAGMAAQPEGAAGGRCGGA